MEAYSIGDGARKRLRTQQPVERATDQESSPPPQLYSSYSPYYRGSVPPKRVACTHCRQSKLRCDSPKDPCTRCARLGLACTKDAGYKRTNRKDKIDELEKHVQELRTVMDQSRPRPSSPGTEESAVQHVVTAAQTFGQVQFPTLSAISPTVSHGETTISTNATFSKPSDVSQLGTQESPQTSIQSPPPASCGFPVDRIKRPVAAKVRAIDSVALAKEQIDCLFQNYFEHFHPFFPLLNPLRSPDEYYDSCPLLFWTLVAVSCRRFGDDPNLLSSLAKSIPKLAWIKISDTPLPYTVAQALLLLCMWPFPGTHMWSDYSTTFSNVALNAAFYMGLHRPDHIKEFTRNRRCKPLAINSTDPLERRKTWAATNIVVQYMSTNVGYPPTGFCFDWSIDRCCETGNVHTLSDDLRYHLMIQRFSNRLSRIMSSNNSDPLGLPAESQHSVMMKALEHELCALESQILGNISVIDRLYLQAMRLQLEIYHWLGPSSPDRTMGVLKSYATATTLIKDMLNADTSCGVISYGPMVFPRIIFAAGYLILKVVHSSFSKYVDSEEGFANIHSVLATIRRYSVEENDQSIRAANILADVWYHRNEALGSELQEPDLVTKSRLGASLMYDCLWHWKEHCIRTESSANPNPGAKGRSPQNQESRVESALQPTDPSLTSFDWDLFDSLNWSWNLDTPSILES